MEAWLSWAMGPAFRFAIAVFLLGLLRHVVLTVLGIRTAMKLASDKNLHLGAVRKATISWLVPTGHLGLRRLFSLTSVVFHVGVILAPLFLTGHVVLIEQAVGVSWPTLPAIVVDVLTVVAILGLATMLVLRLADRHARSLSRVSDYLVLVMVLLPFLSGFLAATPGLNPFPFEATMLVHVLSANLALVLTPFTKLVHIVLLPATQLVSEVGWHFPADGGEKVAKALGKENQPI